MSKKKDKKSKKTQEQPKPKAVVLQIQNGKLGVTSTIKQEKTNNG